MYGTILPEKFKKLNDKSAPRAVPGTFVNLSLLGRTWLLLSTTQLKAFGVARIDEPELIRRAPLIEGSYHVTYADLWPAGDYPSLSQDFDGVMYPEKADDAVSDVAHASSSLSLIHI